MEKIRGKRTFLALVISFIIFNIFIALSSNCYFIGKILKKNYFLTVELQNDTSQESIRNFEKILLENNNVRGIRFLSKEEAFRNLQKELEIVIPRSENSLPNSMIVYFKNEKNLSVLQETLEVEPMVREIYIDNQFLDNIQRKISAANIIFVVNLFLALGAYYQITTILRGNVIRDYIMISLRNPTNTRNFYIVRNRNTGQLIGAVSVGMLLFLNIYILLANKFQQILPGLILQSLSQIVVIEVIITFVVAVLAWKSTGNIKKDEA